MKLDYNKIVSQVSLDLDLSDEEDLKEYKKKKEDKRREDRKTLDRPEWVYNLWYLHLKLCLEMEEKGIPIQLRKKYRSGVKVQRKVNKIHRLKINRKVYEGIDWEELKSLSWNQWKKRYLNVFMAGEIRKIRHGDEWKCEPQYLYLEVDLRNNESVLKNQLSQILKKENRKNLPSNLGIQGQPNYHSSILGYNMTVGRIEGDDWITICNDVNNNGRMEELLKDRKILVTNAWYEAEEFTEDVENNFEVLEDYLKDLNNGKMSNLNQFEGFCFKTFNRYILDTQKVLYNVSQGRFFDKTQIPEGKWKSSWSPKLYTW